MQCVVSTACDRPCALTIATRVGDSRRRDHTRPVARCTRVSRRERGRVGPARATHPQQRPDDVGSRARL